MPLIPEVSNVPSFTVLISPVIASVYFPSGIPVNVASLVNAIKAKLSVVSSVYRLLYANEPLQPSVEYCPFLNAGIAARNLLSLWICNDRG